MLQKLMYLKIKHITNTHMFENTVLNTNIFENSML